jgi:hypothetical protein
MMKKRILKVSEKLGFPIAETSAIPSSVEGAHTRVVTLGHRRIHQRHLMFLLWTPMMEGSVTTCSWVLRKKELINL